ncbi:MAG: hypothetical protein HY423_12835 [Candidatus Lambdaproteobacteria bacterium]|nr:hypothetical protein [Candidatus Lambdaproteobacteria bacterium]
MTTSRHTGPAAAAALAPQQQGSLAPSISQARRAAIAGTLDRVRTLEHEEGVSRPTLLKIRAELLKLAARKDLWPPADFRSGVDTLGNSRIYALAEDADHRFALYMSTSSSAKKVAPHDHTTWAVIVGVEGEEHNRFFERTDDGSVAGRGTLRLVGEETVRPGTGVCLMPDDIHAISTDGSATTLHLHLYGVGMPQQTGRIMFNLTQGTYRPYPASPHIVPLAP